MQDITLLVRKTFEDIKMTDETGFEFWSARTLMKALGYKKWERFGLVIQKAKENCINSGGVISEHFLDEKEFFQEAGKTPYYPRRGNETQKGVLGVIITIQGRFLYSRVLPSGALAGMTEYSL